MKTLTVANQKGGVGKSAIAVQLAYFFHFIMRKRVIFIDLDHQGNSSKAFITGGFITVSKILASMLLTMKVSGVEDSEFVFIAADYDELRDLEKKADSHNAYATNLQTFLKAIDNNFDICIIDTNPNPDIRQLSSLVVSGYVLSPIQLNQEAIDGIGQLLNNEKIGIRKIKAVLNPKLQLIGILPNIVEPTPFQRDNLRDLTTHFAKLLIPMKVGFAAIKKSTAVPEAQAAGVPLWKIPKTSARDAWTQIKPVFETIASTMEVQ